MRIPYLLLLSWFLAGTCISLKGQTSRPMYRILLIGDAGELEAGKIPVLEKARKLFPPDSQTSIIYLGDNVYPRGLPDIEAHGFEKSKAIIDAQIALGAGTGSRVFFVPGNHDWAKGKPGGWARIMNQQRYIDSLHFPNVQLLPRDGCPGPAEVTINERLLLVFIDSQWWLHSYDKPGNEDDCDCKTPQEIALRLREIISANPGKMILLAMHHPLYTYGEHGGFFTLKQHLFPLTELNRNLYIPLPVIGSVYPLSRSLFGNIQDTHHPTYRKMIEELESALKEDPYAIQAAGHEHALQYILHNNKPFIVSGAGSKSTVVKKKRYSRFADSERGFAVINMYEDGKVDLEFYHLSSDSTIFSTQLFSIAPPAAETEANRQSTFPDSIVLPASGLYKAGAWKRKILGDNYRNEWSTPVKVKVFDIGKEHGGLSIIQRGGGLQTRSLRLEDSKGKEYVLRSIEKFPEAAMPAELRETFARDIVQDQISASLPYAALTVPVLANASGVPYAEPQIVYIPDDPKLGKYRSDFSNGLYLYEEREPVPKGKTYSTAKLLEKLQADNDNTVDEMKVLKARLLDMFMADWDRHEDQWRWDSHDHGKGKIYNPIPRDRDQVYFVNEGLLPRLASRPWIMPKIQGFRDYIPDIKRFNFNARYFDRRFLNGLDEENWKKTTDDFLKTMSDSVIEAAMQRLPPEILPLAGSRIAGALKNRRTSFAHEAIVYYRFISKTVDIYGTDKNEIFELADGKQKESIHVLVHKLNKSGRKEDLLYDREFDPAITKEIRLYGLGGNDSFAIHNRKGSIRVRIIGGAGTDAFVINGSKPILYDLIQEQNSISGTGKWKNRLSNDPSVNEFNHRSFHYNVTAPLISLGFNPDDGVYLGAGIRHNHHSFRRSPSAIHEFTISHALATKAFRARYNLQLFTLMKNIDLLLDADLQAPNNVINFFGYGNGTEFDKTKMGHIDYYRARFNLGDLSVLLRRRIGNTVALMLGPAFQYYSIDSSDNGSRFINQTSVNGLDPVALYKHKLFAGAKAGLSIDTRNSHSAPSRGIYWNTSFALMGGLNDFSHRYSSLRSDLGLYMSFTAPASVVIATRFGAGVNTGHFEFYQSQFLGNTDNLRGFRKYRFAGRSMAYNNTEVRIKAADFRTYLFPGSLGFVLFHDIGRVWSKTDASGGWHNGYGAGIWISPVKTIVLTLNYCMSNESKLPLISLGYQF